MVRSPTLIKRLLLNKKLWWRYQEKHKDTIRPVVVSTVTQILACGLKLMGFATYRCSNPDCSHISRIFFGCGSRYCNTCGKKKTDQWIENLRAILPDTPWQHITFTMPDELWPLFKDNRHLLNQLSPLAAKTILTFAEKKGILPGIFTALHTFGRDLKWNVHIHLSASLGGLLIGLNTWKDIHYVKKPITDQWRYAIIHLLRQAKKEGNLQVPEALEDADEWNAFLDRQYKKYWQVHFAKPTNTPLHTIKYLGRYVSRPPLAMSRIREFDGKTVTYRYWDHKTKQSRLFTRDAMEFLDVWTQHIPESGFRMVRYYGFLSHRKRGEQLPIVYKALNQTPQLPDVIRYRQLLLFSFGIDPLECVLCGAQMLFAGLHFKKGNLLQYHRQLALGQNPYGAV